MKTTTPNEPAGLCTVTEMARQVSLSRARFHQLRKLGVFPAPTYSERTGRGYYTPEQQKKCIEIRTTGIGENGEPVLFNAPRQAKSKESTVVSDSRYSVLADLLYRVGVRATSKAVRDATARLYPDGLPEQVTDRKVIQVFRRYFEGGSQDNV